MGTFSYPERSHTVHLRVLKPSLWNSPWRCNHLHDSSSLFQANTSLTTGESTTNYGWWRSLENPRLHKKPSSIANKVYFSIPFLNTWWPLVSDGSLLTGGKCKQVKTTKASDCHYNGNREFTATSFVLFYFVHLFSLSERCVGKEREGFWLCTWCGFSMLVWWQLCLNLLFSWAAPKQAWSGQ